MGVLLITSSAAVGEVARRLSAGAGSEGTSRGAGGPTGAVVPFRLVSCGPCLSSLEEKDQGSTPHSHSLISVQQAFFSRFAFELQATAKP